jgi:hypothetical protein
MMNPITLSRTRPALRATIALLVAGTFVLIFVAIAETAYPLKRPIISGNILQSYLWTAYGTHKGVDFIYPTGTNVYVTADGTVVDLLNSNEDDYYDPLNGWGNFVVIQHDDKYYDSRSDSWSYVYTIYAHLKKSSVLPTVDSSVSEGALIAKSGNTGNTNKWPHLHFQVVLNPQANLKLRPTNTLDSENRSVNPELWLEPLSGKGVVIGKITNSSGNPIPDLVICEIQKSTSGYSSSPTYPSWANPDGVLRENFGTTDVNQGTRELYANPTAKGCNSPYDYSLGTRTFSANRATYVGLYPSWLPLLRPVSISWDAGFFIRNHNFNKVSKSYSTFGTTSSLGKGQRVHNIAKEGMAAVYDEPSTAAMAIVVPSEDSSVAVMITKNNGTQPAGYTSISAAGGIGTSGWEKAGPTVYAPLVKKNWSGRWSRIYVSNVGILPTTVTVTYFDVSGNPYAGGSATLDPNGRTDFTPGSGVGDGYYSAIITSSNNQPVAAVVLEGNGSPTQPDWPVDWPAAYNGFSDGATILYGPLIKKNYAGNTTGITIQNTDFTGDASITVEYYNMVGVPVGTVTDTVKKGASRVIYNPTQIDDGFLGSVRVISTNGKKIVGQMSEADSGSLRLMSNLTFSGTTKIHIPIWYDNYTASGGNWTSGVNVRNTGSGSNNISIAWISQSGSVIFGRTATIAENATITFYDPPQLNNFIGSVLIEGNKPIVAVSNIRNWNGTSGKDAVMAINGSNR